MDKAVGTDGEVAAVDKTVGKAEVSLLWLTQRDRGEEPTVD